jgi:K+/H+ antiporter YhaU regulatory subunit KhtT
LEKAITDKRKANGMVVGIERNGKRLLNPESDLILEKDDILWVVGDKTNEQIVQIQSKKRAYV